MLSLPYKQNLRCDFNLLSYKEVHIRKRFLQNNRDAHEYMFMKIRMCVNEYASFIY